MKSPIAARFSGLALALVAALPAFGRLQTLTSRSGLRVTVDDATGRYEVSARNPAWKLGGDAGGPLRHATIESGRDKVGQYREIRFHWPTGGPALSAAIRLYRDQPAVVFSVACDEPVERMPVLFPRFTRLPAGLHPFSYQETAFAPPVFALEQNGTPWLLFDNAKDAVILSPADQFMVARMVGHGIHEIAGGLNKNLTGLPAHFTQRTLVVLGHGINATWDAWGTTFDALVGRTRPSNEADIGLRYLGYWTDNGAHYYYNYDPALGYAGTLEAVIRRWRQEHIPVRYLQLDSWWYEKTLTGPDGSVGETKNPHLPAGRWNRYGGLLTYEADPSLFPHGLAAFQKQIGLPLITHNRWIDPASPYHRNYHISGIAAVDPRWWEHIMTYLAAAGVTTYEQDWLDRIYCYSPALRGTPGAGDAFTGGMAHAAQAHDLTLQYCMPLPRHFLQGARYDNLTTIRVSRDRFNRARWDHFLYVSRLARAVGIWPWTDVFMSRETNNLLLATLSSGMVGVGDAIGAEDKANLLSAVRSDGVIVKPDEPIVPADSVYTADSTARGASPMVAWTYTDHGPLRTVYVFAYRRHGPDGCVRITPGDFGLPGHVIAYEPRSGLVEDLRAGESFVQKLPVGGTAYWIIAPVGPSRIAFFGDLGKFVSNGRQRIAAVKDANGKVDVTVIFAKGESSVRLFGFARRALRVRAVTGSVKRMQYNGTYHRFEVDVSPAPSISRETPGGDPIRQARVEFWVPPASPHPLGSLGGAKADPLVDGFYAPPPAANPLAWWRWINGNVTKSDISVDLADMRRVGIAGVQMFDVSMHVPPGAARYESDLWNANVLHAIREAGRQGLEFSMQISPGWSASGGPWVTPARSMKQLVWSETEAEGGSQFVTTLPQPFNRLGYYRDVATLAVPDDGAEANLLRTSYLVRTVIESSTGSVNLNALYDRNPATSVTFGPRGARLDIEFDQPVPVSQLSMTLAGLLGRISIRGSIDGSLGGRTFVHMDTFAFKNREGVPAQFIVPFKGKQAKVVRVRIERATGGRRVGFGLSELALGAPPRLDDWTAKVGMISRPLLRPRPGTESRRRVIFRNQIIDVTNGLGADGSTIVGSSSSLRCSIGQNPGYDDTRERKLLDRMPAGALDVVATSPRTPANADHACTECISLNLHGSAQVVCRE